MTPTHTQLKYFLETCEARLDITDMSKCIAYLYDENGGSVAEIDFDTEKYLCEDTIWIDGNEYGLTDFQKDFVCDHLEDETVDLLHTWKEIKKDTYDVRYDQY